MSRISLTATTTPATSCPLKILEVTASTPGSANTITCSGRTGKSTILTLTKAVGPIPCVTASKGLILKSRLNLLRRAIVLIGLIVWEILTLGACLRRESILPK